MHTKPKAFCRLEKEKGRRTLEMSITSTACDEDLEK